MSDPSFEIGETVVDREDAQAPPLVVVSLPAPTAADWLTYGGTTVAHDNPGYPADARLVVVVAAADLATYLPEWDAETPLPRATLDESGVYYEALPVPRLSPTALDAAADSDPERRDDPGDAHDRHEGQT